VRQPVFIDTNIIIDLLTNREPFADDAASLFEYIAAGKVRAFTSANCLANVFYILSSVAKHRDVREKIRDLMQYLRVVATDAAILTNALSSDFREFEDAIQYYSAIKCDARYIVTRNPKDFRTSKIPLVSAQEMCDILRSA
jgi:predicted nucleic acid-binding protein